MFCTCLAQGSSNLRQDDPSLPVFSVPGGFYFQPVTVAIHSPEAGKTIKYTTDGSLPGPVNGKIYVSPLQVNRTTILRAVAITGSVADTVTATSSYLFPDDIIHLTGIPNSYPSTWGRYTDISGYAKGDYEMDPEIVNHADYKNLIIPSLLSVPSLSVVTPRGFLFSSVNHPDTGGIYIYTGANGGTGDNWERPASVEYIDPVAGVLFRTDCGIQIQGGAGRLADKNPKHSFRLVFRDDYGPGKLKYDLFGGTATQKFNGLVLRATFGNSWRHWEPSQRNRATHLRDLWAKDTQLEMGHAAAHSKFFHLYLNGIYWGLYNFSERIDDDFMESYFGGEKQDYDVMKDYAELMDGSKDAWNYLWSAVSGNILDNTVYQRLIGNNPDGSPNETYPAYVDPVNLIDYMLINFYGGNNDWDHHNWVAGRNRLNPGKGFVFFCWDEERILESETQNTIDENNENRPSGIFRKLLANQEFKLLFADRVNLHLTGGGILTPAAAANRWLKRAAEIDTALIAESARWGDYRRDVHPYKSSPYPLFTYKDHWLKEHTRLINNYFPVRTQILLDQLSAAGLLPAIAAPVFNSYGGEVEMDFNLKITANEGIVYYTPDGSDPRITGGGISPSAIRYTAPVSIDRDGVIKARAKSGNTWSAVTVAFFRKTVTRVVGTPFQLPESTLSVYPNPVRDVAVVKFGLPVAGKASLSVYRTDGRMVEQIQLGFRSQGEQVAVWKPLGIPAGLYILSVSGDHFHRNVKVILHGSD